ncbi:MAG: hypothetical protein HY877_05615 [Deltaproteobacteria bacterium]|nr:hypothetical protein [Deltaproteobacteria bacterium]
MSWFRLSLRVVAKQFPISGEIASAVRPRNDEVTDPGIDIYIPSEIESVKTAHAERAPQILGPIRWVQQLLAKRQALEIAKEIISKVELLPQSPDGAIRYFFDNDLPALVRLSQRYPVLVQKMLNEKLENSPTRQFSEPWYRLVQVACGDTQAILPALDGLC